MAWAKKELFFSKWEVWNSDLPTKIQLFSLSVSLPLSLTQQAPEIQEVVESSAQS